MKLSQLLYVCGVVLNDIAIAAYVVSMLGVNIAQVHVFGPNLYEVFLEVASPANASLAYAVTWLLAVCAVAWFMYRRRWFLRF